MTTRIPATLIPGDGIGPEIVDAPRAALDALGAPFEWRAQIAGRVGGLGMVPGANNGADTARFEAVHGSAPDVAGQCLADPVARASMAQAIYRARFPEAEPTFALGDFQFVRLLPRSTRFVAGFGRATV